MRNIEDRDRQEGRKQNSRDSKEKKTSRRKSLDVSNVADSLSLAASSDLRRTRSVGCLLYAGICSEEARTAVAAEGDVANRQRQLWPISVATKEGGQQHS